MKVAENNLRRVDYDLVERIKEMKCLSRIAIVIDEPDITLDELYQRVVDLLPHGWQYPEITCARITIGNKTFTTRNYRATAWKLSSVIRMHGAKLGTLEVNYLEERPEIEVGPFLKGERLLINIIASQLGRITGSKQVEGALQQTEEFSSNILNNASNPILMVNPDTSIRYVNPALEKLTGCKLSELIGTKSPYPWWRKEALCKTDRILRKAMRKGARGVEELMRNKHGEQFWIRVNAVPVFDNGELTYYISIWTDITEQRELRENLQSYVTGVIKAQEEERKRIARELHDGTIQELSCVLNDVGGIIRDDKEQLSDRFAQQLKQLQVKIDGVVSEVRRFCYDLRPDMLDRFGLVPLLELLAEEMNLKKNINCRTEVIGHGRRLSTEIELVLFRIAQEALCNLRKHAKATQAIVRVEFSNKRVVLRITDNGVGFRVPKMLSCFARRGKLGIMGMKERIRLLDGSIRVESKVGKGTSITVQIPA